MQLLDFLRERNYVSEATYAHVVEYIEHWKCSDYDAVLETHLFTEAEIADYLATGLSIERVEKLSSTQISLAAAVMLPYSIAYELNCLPLKVSGNKGSMDVVFLNPLNSEHRNKVSQFVKMDVRPLVAERSEIQKAIRMHYPTTDQLKVYEQV